MSRPRWWRLIPPGLVAVAAVGVLAVQPGTWREQPVLFAMLALLVGAAMLAGLAVVRGGDVGTAGRRWILAVGTLLALLGTGIAPSDDVFRYAVEGRQVLAGQNPYAVPPADPGARALVPPAIADGVNHPEMTAIYPPAALGLHAVVAAITPRLGGFQVLAAVLALVAIALAAALLHRPGRDPALVVALAWNPVLPLFAAGEAHHDIAMAVLALAAVAGAVAARPWRAVLATGLAALVKPFALAVVPALLPATGGRRWLVLPVLALAAYLPFAGAGWGLTASFATYAGERHFHGALDPWLRDALRPLVNAAVLEPAVRGALALLLVGGGWWLHRRTAGRALPERAAAFTALLLLCLPTLHPWYFTALAVFLPFSASWALPLWTACAGVYWLHGVRILEIGAWTETRWVTALAHLPALGLLLVEIVCRPAPRETTHG